MKNSDKNGFGDNTNKKIILDLAGGTGAWSLPYKKAKDKKGQPIYDVRVITLPEYDIESASFGDEQMSFENEQYRMYIDLKNIYGILAAPPCTMFSRARTRATKPRNVEEGMVVVRACMEIIWRIQERAIDSRGVPILKFWALENPMGSLRRFLGRPDLTFTPANYGDPWTKRTDVWGWFNKPKKKPVKLSPEQHQLCAENNRKLPSISDFTSSKNTVRRAITPPGFAQAFFKANR